MQATLSAAKWQRLDASLSQWPRAACCRPGSGGLATHDYSSGERARATYGSTLAEAPNLLPDDLRVCVRARAKHAAKLEAQAPRQSVGLKENRFNLVLLLASACNDVAAARANKRLSESEDHVAAQVPK